MRALAWTCASVAAVAAAGLGGWLYGWAVELAGGGRSGELPVVEALPEPYRERPQDPGGYTPEHLDARVLARPRDPDAPAEGDAPPDGTPPPAPGGPAPSGGASGAPPVPPERPAESPARAAGEGVSASVALQLGSFASLEAAERTWIRLRRAHPAVFTGGVRHRIRELDQGGGRVLYRLRAGPFAGRARAEAACAALKATGRDCFSADWR